DVRESHIFFSADDALFCFKATPDICQTPRSTLEEFYDISSEMINYKKPHVQLSRNTPTNFIHFMRNLRVGSQDNIRSYLGYPMDVDGRSTTCFTQIQDKIIKCISSWKYACLCSAGRSVLINSILVAMTAHIMSIYMLPPKTLDKLNSALLSLVEQRKEEGGIELHNICSVNKAPLFRQIWRIDRKPDSLVGRLLNQRYGGSPIQAAKKARNMRNSSWVFRNMVSV
ncbi:hypothetical protein RDABS01_022280, partial [Bienertia sinuspersici]